MKTVVKTPFELLFDQLRDIYSMEVQLCESMPPLVSLCTNGVLRVLIVSYAHQNCNQIAEIDSIIKRHGESPAMTSAKHAGCGSGECLETIDGLPVFFATGEIDGEAMVQWCFIAKPIIGIFHGTGMLNS